MSQQALIPIEPQLPIQREPSFVEVIAQAARDPQIDIAKMKELLAMKERVDAKVAETAFHQSMRDAQDEMRPILRDSMNEHTRSRYAKLEKIDAAIRPIYTAHGFSLSFDSPSTEGDNVTVSCTVFHVAGHSKTYTLSGSLDGVGAKGNSNKTAIQALGSTVSYLRRYLECMIFNVVLTNEDNDGNGASRHITQDQADSIQNLVTELGMQPAAVSSFLEIMEAKSIAEIKSDRYRQAMTLLQAKRRAK